MTQETEGNQAVRVIRIMAACGSFALCALVILKLGLMLCKGGETAWIIYAGKGIYAGHPLKYVVYGLASFLGGYLLLVAPRFQTKGWSQLAGKLVLLAFSVSVTLLTAEVGIRAYFINKLQANSLDRLKKLYRTGQKPEVHTTHPMSYIIQPTDDPHLVYDLQPHLDMEFGHKRLRTNSAGMRAGHDYPLARRPNSVRIVGVGDSGMFGWNCEQGEEYMAVLESNLNQRANGVLYETLNFAVPGYNTALEAETVHLKALLFQPDIVVVGWCENDFELPFFMLEQGNFRRRDVSFLYQL